MKQIKGRNKFPNFLKGKLNKNPNKKENQKKSIITKELSQNERLSKLEVAFCQGRQEYINLFKKCPEALVYTDIDGIVLTVNDYPSFP